MAGEAAAGSTGEGATGGNTGASAPAAGASSQAGGASSAPSGASGGGAASSSGKSDGDVDALKAENERLAKELAKATGKAGTMQSDFEKRLSALETRATTAETEAANLKRAQRVSATTDAIVAEVPEAHRAVARAIVRGYGSDGVDLAAEDQKAVSKTVLERLGKEFPELMQAPTGSPHVPRIPTIPNGQPKVEQLGGIVVGGVKVL